MHLRHFDLRPKSLRIHLRQQLILRLELKLRLGFGFQIGHDLSENLEAEIIAELPDTIITTHVEPLEDERSWADQTEGQYRWR